MSQRSSNGYCSGAFESTQRVDAGRSFQLRSTKIQASDGQNIFIRYDTFAKIDKLSIIVLTIMYLQIYRRQLIELVQECRNCISPQNRHNSR